MAWDKLADNASVERTIAALQKNGINAQFVQTEEDAKKAALAILPPGAEVMGMTSVTLDTIGAAKEIAESGKYVSLKNKLMAMDRNTQGAEMRKIGAAPDWAIGSVHALTEEGEALIASNTGSQLPAYAYGASHVIWVVGAQKIVKNREEGFRRIYEHCLVLESVRAKKAYGVAGSSVNKILVVDKEVIPNRISVIIVNQVLGF